MWNTRSCSKLLQSHTNQKNYQIHRKKLLSMQSCIKIQQPRQPTFIYSKNKFLNRQKTNEIDRINHILLSKIQTIRLQDNNVNKFKSQNINSKMKNTKKTIKAMKAMTDQIKDQNKRICNKLLNVQSHYHINEMLQKADHLSYVASNISKNARRCISASATKLHPLGGTSSTFCSFYKKLSAQHTRPIHKIQKLPPHTPSPQKHKIFTRVSVSDKKHHPPTKSSQKLQYYNQQNEQLF